MLQWSPGVVSGKSLGDERGREAGAEASMEPRSRVREKSRRPRLVEHEGRRFNGAPESCPGKARVSVSMSMSQSGDTLQWSPGVVSGKRRPSPPRPSGRARRFNGAPESCPGKDDAGLSTTGEVHQLQWSPGVVSGKSRRPYPP